MQGGTITMEKDEQDPIEEPEEEETPITENDREISGFGKNISKVTLKDPGW